MIFSVTVGKKRLRRNKMENENRRQDLEWLLRGCPDILSPIQAARWTKKSKNTIYALLKSGELRSFVMRGAHLISKLDLIDYLLLHADDTDGKRFRVGGDRDDG